MVSGSAQASSEESRKICPERWHLAGDADHIAYMMLLALPQSTEVTGQSSTRGSRVSSLRSTRKEHISW